MDIVSTAFVILVAGYDTTSQVLSYAGIQGSISSTFYVQLLSGKIPKA